MLGVRAIQGGVTEEMTRSFSKDFFFLALEHKVLCSDSQHACKKYVPANEDRRRIHIKGWPVYTINELQIQ